MTKVRVKIIKVMNECTILLQQWLNLHCVHVSFSFFALFPIQNYGFIKRTFQLNFRCAQHNHNVS